MNTPPSGFAFEDDNLVPVADPTFPVDEKLTAEQELDEKIRGILRLTLDQFFGGLLKRSGDHQSVGRRVFALLYLLDHSHVAGLTQEEIAKKVGLTKQRFGILVNEASSHWGFSRSGQKQ
jgi:hypothetical protein